MMTLASGLSYIDLHFQGVPRIIATAVAHGPGGVALIDPGPSSTLPMLRRELEHAGLSMADVRALVLTHIHLDHAGATGTLVRERPDLRVYVHEKGAPHMIDPAKLLASAARLYGDAMDRLWGEVRPVPADAIAVLKGGERISAGGRDLEVAYTPGHASHHVSYFSADSGIAFVGDTAGVRLSPGGFNLPPTPPPRIDFEGWHQSLARLGRCGAGWRGIGGNGLNKVGLRDPLRPAPLPPTQRAQTARWGPRLAGALCAPKQLRASVPPRRHAADRPSVAARIPAARMSTAATRD